MFWQKFLDALAIDPSAAMEAADPFYVPGRDQEALSFGTVGIFGLMLLTAMFLLPFRDWLLVGGPIAIVSLLLFVRALQQRRHRLKRLNAVSNLRQRLLRGDEFNRQP